jgi:4-diphosphocytidyl-2-C-methyl-D-erythritol kinase
MYTAWDRLKSKKLAPPLNPLLTALSQKNLPQIGQHLYNDFEQILFPQYPLLKKLKVKLKELGCLGCLVSGSGASVFGIFEGKKEKERAIKSLRSEFADFFVF